MVHDDGDAGSAEAHDRVAGSARFTLKKDGPEFEDEEYCTPYAGPQLVEHQALHLPRVRGCFGCDHGKAAAPVQATEQGSNPWADRPRRDFETVWRARAQLKMKNGSKAHRIAARALLITDQETEFFGCPTVEAQVGLRSDSCAS